MIKLRGHHLVCLHFFSGESFSEEFISNLRDIKKRANEGETINTGYQADDICKMCVYLKNKKCLYSENADIEIMNMDKTAMALLELKQNTNLKWQKISARLPSMFKDWYIKYCVECDWLNICRKNKEFLKLIAAF
ncbi:MAG: DUF1284 domain-containing protein [Nitrospirae bacterium]|jgi:hypothetical protein|nr:DUF1284 domain-containing protein [Nitrospirota bacterium]